MASSFNFMCAAAIFFPQQVWVSYVSFSLNSFMISFFLCQGKIAERGDHHTLLNLPGSLYADLWNTQNNKILNSTKNSLQQPAERLSQKEEERKKLQEEILNSVKGCGNCSCWERLPPPRLFIPHRWPTLESAGVCAVQGRELGRGTSPLPTPTSARPPPMWLPLLLLVWIKATARQSEGGGAEQGASVFSAGWCPEMELLCQLPQLKPSIRDLVYHIRVCKTSVSQHGCPPPPSSSFLTSGLLTSSIALETDESTRNDLHMPWCWHKICSDLNILNYFQNKLNLKFAYFLLRVFTYYDVFCY